MTVSSPLTSGIAICMEMDFAGDARLHGRMSEVRGVENGFAVARMASDGLMTLTGANGLIVARKFSAEGPQTLVAELPTGLGHTVSSRIGDVFPRLWSHYGQASLPG